MNTKANSESQNPPQPGNTQISATFAIDEQAQPPVGKSIEHLIKTDRLALALEWFSEFVDCCNSDDITAALVHTQARLSSVDAMVHAGTITHSEAAIERNNIRFGFQGQMLKFRKEVLAKYFDLHGEAEFLGKITSRDQVIHEILDMQLLPKQYIRDEKWDKVEGNSSIIYRLRNTDTQRHAIAMVIKTPEIEQSLKSEIMRLTDLRHRNIIKLLDHNINRFPFFVITEYVHGENLMNALEVVGPRPVAQAADWLYQLSDALDYLRHKRILHTNVRPSKIYIDNEWQVMISPFDLFKAPQRRNSTTEPNKVDNPQETPGEHDKEEQPQETPGERTFNRYRDVCQYGSPELFERDGDGFSDPQEMCISDMYSLGLVGYKMLTGEDLFHGRLLYEILENRRRFDQDEGFRAEKLAKLPAGALTDIIQNLLQKDKSERRKRYKNLRGVVHALNPLIMAEKYEDTELQKSYRRCLANSREFINDFYESFLKISPHKDDFDDLKLKRQSAMLQMAMDVLLDLDNKGHLLAKMVHPAAKSHANYKTDDFKMFLDALIQTVKKHDGNWDATVEKAWLGVRDGALEIIGKHR